MASEPREFSTRFAYHIYNCGVEKRRTFLSIRDYEKFLETISFYKYNQTLPLKTFDKLTFDTKEAYLFRNPRDEKTRRVNILAYCFMPNHFHLLIRPENLESPGKVISDIQNSYTKYFNKKNDRIGSLFQGKFKSKRLQSNGDVLNVSRYIHLNPVKSTKTNPGQTSSILNSYSYSSYQTWVNPNRKDPIVDSKSLRDWISLAGGANKYKEFVTAGIKKNIAVGIEKSILEKPWE